MRRILNKVLAGVTSAALVATLLAGVQVTKNVMAEDKEVALTNWTFIQGGMYLPTWIEDGNEGYIGSVVMNDTDEVLDGWLKGNGEAWSGTDPSVNQTQTAKDISTGFALDIENTGWDRMWATGTGDEDKINPWSIRASMEDVSIDPGHIYTVSFKASASKKKYCYVSFSNEFGDTPYLTDVPTGNNQIIAIDEGEQTYTYTFTNHAFSEKLTATLLLGAFATQVDYDGKDISDIVTEPEIIWNGTVYVSNFKITDQGLSPEYTEEVTEPEETEPTEEVTMPEETETSEEITEPEETETSEEITEPEETETSEEITDSEESTIPEETESVDDTTIEENQPTEKETTTKSAVETTTASITSGDKTTSGKTQVEKPSKVSLKTVKNVKGKKAKLTWKKLSGVKGYQIQYALNKKFTKSKKTTTATGVSKTIKKLKKKKTYYFRVRAYKKSGSKKVYGAWSKVKKVKVKK